MLYFSVALTYAAPAFADAAPREHLSLDANWTFHLGNDYPGALNLYKAGASTGPASEVFSDASWRTLNLPHDWAVELPFDKTANVRHGFKPVGPGFLNTSVGWYRRTFDLPASDAGKRIWLTFDGVYRDTTVWVNGWLMRRHEGGYEPFREDITDVVKFGGKNLLTVQVDASKFEGWFYEGAGIYRHVWLDKTAPVAIAPEGIFVRSEFANNLPTGSPEVKVAIDLLNSQATPAKAAVGCEILSPDGKSVATFSGAQDLGGDSKQVVNLQGRVAAPELWSPESPKLYKLVTTVTVDGKVTDVKETAFGLRTIAFDKDLGFLLNGKPCPVQGTCNHQDHAGVGVALPDALQSFRIARLKEYGCNAYRTSHHAPTPELLDACDRQGMLVMDECRLLGSDSENLRKWAEQIRRDRNHPSVFLWSVANEEFTVHSTPQGGNAARSMQALAKRLDPTRPVTYAAPQGDTVAGINGVIEVRGWNYHLDSATDDYHRKNPGQGNICTEQASRYSTRGVYQDDGKICYLSSYDYERNSPGWVNSAEAWWTFVHERPWLSGGFVWTGFDYRGEQTPYRRWPSISSQFGILDTCGFPKDNAFYYKAVWTKEPVLHLVPGHWNWPGKEGQEIRVDALTNCKEVEVFLNGQSIGKKSVKPCEKISFTLKYAPGVLSAKGFDANGKLLAEAKVETTGEPVAVKLTRESSGLSKSVHADGEDLAIFAVSAVDAQGRPVPTAQNPIQFSIKGEGRILAVGNGDPSCHEPDVVLPPCVRTLPVSGWRWKYETFPTKGGETTPVVSAGVDESGWNAIETKTDAEMSDMPLAGNRTAVYRGHVNLTAEDLDTPGLRIQFSACNQQGWYFINGQLVGESHDPKKLASFEIKSLLHPGDNVIAVGVQSGQRNGGLDPDVSLEIGPKSKFVNWSRSLFNGQAQIIVQSSQNPGEIHLNATADGLQPASASLKTQPRHQRPSAS